MTDQTPMAMALPLRTLRRNRRLLALCAGGAVTVLCALTATLLCDPQSAPLLLAIDEYSLQSSPNETLHSAIIGHKTPRSTNPLGPDSGMPWRLPVMENLTALAAEFASESSDQVTPSDPNVRWFNGRPIRAVRTMEMTVTAYSPDEQSCGESADGITASGYSVWTNGMKLAAADTRILPFGSLISVPGYDHGNVVPVLDRGGAIKGHRLDMLYPTHQQARGWGVQKLTVTIWEYADGLPCDFRTQYTLASR